MRSWEAFPPALRGTPEGLAAITSTVGRLKPVALVALLDPDLLWLATTRQAFGPSCPVLAPSAESLTRLLSKAHQLGIATQAGLSILPTHLVVRAEDVDAIPTADFPLAVRPDRPGCVLPTFKVTLATSPEQLRSLIRERQRIDAPLVAQPFRSVPNLVVHGVRSADGQILASRCYLAARKFQGISLSIEPWPFPDGLEDKCHEFARLAGLTGCYHFEFLFSEREHLAHFLEVNVRMGGTTDKVRRTGFDEPLLMLQSYGIASNALELSEPSPRRVVNKRTVLKHIAWALRGRLTAFDYPNTSPLMHVAYSCRDLIVARDSVFDWRDVLTSLRFQLR
ncbi:MAG: hypothetical protein ABL961_14070 [Vicinamibacterales bacterium]